MPTSTVGVIDTTPDRQLKDPWLVAAWPGIGNVAIGAATYLIEQLGAELVHELPDGEFFQPSHVDVGGGIARRAPTPRSMFFEWRNEDGSHDLIIFLGEAQPTSDGDVLCRRIIDYALQRGASRTITFAALATQLHPSATPNVFGVATDQKLLTELRESGAKILEDGQIGGLNGLLLAASAERDLPGVCLLAELPFFAGGVQNPGASMAALKIFARLSEIEIDFQLIRDAAHEFEEVIINLLEQMKDAAKRKRHELMEPDDSKDASDFMINHDEHDQESAENADVSKLVETDRTNIEQLFEKAQSDRSAAFQLKQELDRLGVFDQYEDRFLDLFKRAE